MCCRNFTTSVSSALFRASSCFRRSFALVITRDFEGFVRANSCQYFRSRLQEVDVPSEEVSKRYRAKSAILSLRRSR